MTTKHIRLISAIAFIAMGITSCKVTQRYKTPDNLQSNQLYRDVNSSDTTSIANLSVETFFSDNILKDLIKEGVAQNLDLKSAIERIVGAQAELRASRAAYLPSLSLNLSAAENKLSKSALNFPPSVDINLHTQMFKAEFNASWELDIWGKIGSSKRAALAAYLQTEAAKRAVQTQLVASIANNYYSLIALDEQLKITEQTLQSRIKAENTMKALKNAAIVNGAAVVQSEANRYATEVSIPDLKRSIRETENALSILLGKAPGSISRNTLSGQKPYADLKTGVSSQLLKNRPDVQAAEFTFRNAFENTNVAKTNFYPSLTLTANGGLSSLSIENLLKNSVFYGIIGGLTQPIFNKRLNKSRLALAKTTQKIAFYDFQKTILTAGSEVSDALFAYQTALDKQQSRAKQIAALEKAVDYTLELLKYSSATNYTDVLTSEQALLAAQLNGINDKLQQLQATVNLYRALGGGWQ